MTQKQQIEWTEKRVGNDDEHWTGTCPLGTYKVTESGDGIYGVEFGDEYLATKYRADDGKEVAEKHYAQLLALREESRPNPSSPWFIPST